MADKGIIKVDSTGFKNLGDVREYLSSKGIDTGKLNLKDLRGLNPEKIFVVEYYDGNENRWPLYLTCEYKGEDRPFQSISLVDRIIYRNSLEKP